MNEDLEYDIYNTDADADLIIDLKNQLRNMAMMFNTNQNDIKFYQLLRDLQSNRQNLFTLSFKQKQFLMNFIFLEQRNDALPDFEDYYQNYLEVIKEFEEETINQQIKFIKKKKIIGMTVNGCAKYSAYLNQLKAPIMVIEEAGEVLESQNIAILTQNLQHLILIGDHQQLRPKVQTYELEKNYNYNMSLFERLHFYLFMIQRLILNNVKYETLNIQRRMRPIFADFIRLFYGDQYKDSCELETQDNIKGISSNIYFIDHKIFENSYQETKSKINEHEVQFTIRLAKYLIQQGYQTNQITILTLYVGQTLSFKKNIRKFQQLTGIKVATVDNYQGEENDIILLSLVRSNKECNLGFAKNSNRIIVSLSRAKLGFYAIGNFSCLANGKGGEKWKQVVKLALQKQVIGNKLKLCCQNHNRETYVQTIEDFKKVPEGGCQEICNIRKPCGHVCKLHCHITEHLRELCTEKCAKEYSCGHKCQKLCREKCNLNCEILVEKTLQCGHRQKAKCYLKINEVQCENPCEKKLKCGHKCKRLCYEKCDDFSCKEEIKFTLPCGHENLVLCSDDKDSLICQKPCEQTLPCGHQCKGSCSKCFKGQIHYPCQSKCKKTLICGHACETPCSLPCQICEQKCNYQCCQAKCTLKCGQVCFQCNNQCENKCSHSKCTKLCHEMCDKPICNRRCTKQLKCKHQCIGLCGEECIEICRKCNPDNDIFNIFFGTEDNEEAKFYKLQCGHIFEVEGLDKFFKTQNEQQSNSAMKWYTCPLCQKPITKSFRYQSYLKEVQENVNKIKQQLIDATLIDKNQLNKLQYNIYKVQASVSQDTPKTYEFINKSLGYIKEFKKDSNSNAINYFISLQNKVSLANIIFEIERFSLTYKNNIINQTDFLKNMHKEFKENLSFLIFVTWKKTFLASQEHWDMYFRKAQNLDVYRQIILAYQSSLKQNTKNLIINYLGKLVETNFFMDENLLQQCTKDLKCMLVPTMEEKIQIHKALGLAQGHWFKCPNGHFYIITDCGGAMEESKCPECGAKIGGQNHTLTSGNAHTGEIDGSNYAAWSNEANMNLI